MKEYVTNRKRGIGIGLVMGLLVAACSHKGQTAIDRLDADALFQRALNDMQTRHFTTAAELFERFTLQYPSHPRLQEARFDLGQSYFGKKEYITAANEFSRLSNDFPAGPYADDARYMVCESYAKLSPAPELDQQYTKGAIEHCQSLISYYPTSEFVPKAQQRLTEMKTKLAMKEFINAEFYFQRKAYDSAIIYYELAVNNYPDTDVAPRALMRMYDAYKILNYKEEMETTRQRLLKDYPNSSEAKQLQQAAPAAS